MLAVALPPEPHETAFRERARQCLARGLAPDEVMFVTGEGEALFETLPPGGAPPPVMVPRRFADLMRDVLCHRSEDRFALLYRALWRLQRGERDLLGRPHDPLVARLLQYARAVERDIYRMHAFLRFREQRIEGRVVFVAWFEPHHLTLRRAVPFFVDRFANMEWLIATPIGTAAWREGELTFGPPAPSPAQGADAILEEVWLAYYRATFNPARLRVDAMLAQMPKRHWKTMPETALVPQLIRDAAPRAAQMRARAPDPPPRFAAAVAARLAAPAESDPAPLEALRREAHACMRCPLHGPATQTVFGEGPLDAKVVFVGEQPGDQEDLAGRPFVGPAGQVFGRALAMAGLDRRRAYVTNAVKHFKFEPRGKRRIHQKPGAGEIQACRWWLERELAVLQPKLVVALGATAAASLAGRPVSVTRERGRLATLNGLPGLVTVHPSYLLRISEPAAAEAEFERFVADLRLVAPRLEAA